VMALVSKPLPLRLRTATSTDAMVGLAILREANPNPVS